MKSLTKIQKGFNPLAPVQNPTAAQLRDREMKDLIKADVHRTCQEFAYFRSDRVKQQLQQMLYMWNAEHEIGYKQGMNELLAVIVIVFETERCADVPGCEPEFAEADTFVFFDKLMSFVVSLYTDTKDLHRLNEEMTSS